MSSDVGVLKGVVTLDASAVTKGMGDAAQSVEQFARRAKKMANDFAMVGAAITASVVGAVSQVASVSPGAHASMENLTNATQTLGIQVAKVAAPALKVMADSLRDIANYLAGLSPQTKQHIADMVILAAQVGVAALAFGRLMEVLKGTAALFEGLTVVLGVVFSPVGIAIAAVIAALLVLRQAWINNWGGIRDAVRSVITDISGYWTKLTDFLGEMWKKQVDDAATGLKAIVQLFFTAQKAMADAGLIKANPLAGLEQSGINKGIDMAAGIAKSPKAMGNIALDVGKALKSGAMDMAAEFKKKLADLMASLGFDLKSSARNGTAESPANPEFLKQVQLAQAEARAGALAANQRGIDVARQQRDFNNIGAPQSAVLAQMTQGFADFDDALKKGSQALAAKTALDSQAKVLELQAQQLDAQGAHELAAQALDSANQLKLLSQNAGDMAVKADEAAKAFSEIKDTAQKQFVGALKIAGDSLTSNLGKLGTTINAGIQGFQQGGVWGAVIAVVMQFITQVKGWTQIMQIGNGQFQMALNDMSKGLGDLLNGLKPLMGAIESIAHVLHGVLNPIFSLLGNILQGIAPVFELIGIILTPLATSLKTVFDIIGPTLKPAFDLLDKVLTGVALLFMALVEPVLYLKAVFLELAQWIDHTFNPTGDHSGIDQAVADAWTDLHNNEAQMANVASNGLSGLANQSAQTAEALGRTADAAQSVTEQLLNVPEGIKVAAYAYSASNGTGGGGQSSGSSSTSPSGMRSRYLSLGTTVDPSRYPKKKP